MRIGEWIYRLLDSDRIFEEMDRIEMETRLLERDEEDSEDVTTTSSTKRATSWITVATVAVAATGSTVAALCARKSIIDSAGLATITAAGVTVVGATVAAAGLRYWCRRRVWSIRRLIEQMESTRAAIRKRRHLFFSISMRVPAYRNPLVVRACRVAVSGIECLVAETQTVKKKGSDTWHDLYTPEMLKITRRSAENGERLEIETLDDENDDENLDFETVLETLIAIFKLHASEYCRLFLLDVLKNSQFAKLRKFFAICGKLQEIRWKMEAIEKSALKCEKYANKSEKIGEKKERKMEKNVEFGWKQQTEMALEAILDGMSSSGLTRSEVELALRRTLLLVASEHTLNSSTTKSVAAENAENRAKAAENAREFEENATRIIEQPNDVDQVFEGIPLSEEAKTRGRAAAARDVLLDGSESRKHEASLLGELQMVLEPRRNDFERRERRALAKFYGLDEQELRRKEQREAEEENFVGVGTGETDAQPEPYDWRKEAENSAGIHRDAENVDFLRALAARRVQDDVIE